MAKVFVPMTEVVLKDNKLSPMWIAFVQGLRKELRTLFPTANLGIADYSQPLVLEDGMINRVWSSSLLQMKTAVGSSQLSPPVGDAVLTGKRLSPAWRSFFTTLATYINTN